MVSFPAIPIQKEYGQLGDIARRSRVLKCWQNVTASRQRKDPGPRTSSTWYLYGHYRSLSWHNNDYRIYESQLSNFYGMSFNDLSWITKSDAQISSLSCGYRSALSCSILQTGSVEPYRPFLGWSLQIRKRSSLRQQAVQSLSSVVYGASLHHKR